MGHLDGKAILLIGAAAGDGEAIARGCVAEGAEVLIADVRDAAGTRVASELGKHVAAYLHLDAAQPSDWELAAAYCASQWGRLDGLVNCAIGQPGVQLALDALVDLLEAPGAASVVNVAPSEDAGELTRIVAAELAPRAIRVNAVFPHEDEGERGLIATTIYLLSDAAAGRTGEEIAVTPDP